MEKPAICGGEPVRSTKIFYGHQFIDEDDIQAVVDVLKSDYLTCGPKIGELEQNMQLYAAMGQRHFILPVWQPELCREMK